MSSCFVQRDVFILVYSLSFRILITLDYLYSLCRRSVLMVKGISPLLCSVGTQKKYKDVTEALWLECRFWVQKVDGSNPSINMFSP